MQSRFSEETSCLESNEILKLYRKVISVNHDWEDGHFYMGKYYDKIITTLLEDRQERPNPSKQWYVLTQSLKGMPGSNILSVLQFYFYSMSCMLSFKRRW